MRERLKRVVLKTTEPHLSSFVIDWKQMNRIGLMPNDPGTVVKL